MAFGTDESVLFREVSLIQGVLIERFHCILKITLDSIFMHLKLFTIIVAGHIQETI